MVHVRVGDEVVVSNRVLAPEKAQEIQDFSRRFNERFERRYRRRVEEEALQALGADLFAFWLGDVWKEVIQHIREECLPDYDFDGLPELLTYPEDEERAYRDDDY